MADVGDTGSEPEDQQAGSTPRPARGTALWTSEVSADLSDGLVVDGEMVFVSAGSTVNALDATTGELRWQSTPTRAGSFGVRIGAGSDMSGIRRIAARAGVAYLTDHSIPECRVQAVRPS